MAKYMVKTRNLGILYSGPKKSERLAGDKAKGTVEEMRR
jgi:hypothetical protein